MKRNKVSHFWQTKNKFLKLPVTILNNKKKIHPTLKNEINKF